jgi:hypothetical protein
VLLGGAGGFSKTSHDVRDSTVRGAIPAPSGRDSVGGRTESVDRHSNHPAQRGTSSITLPFNNSEYKRFTPESLTFSKDPNGE